MDAAIQEILNDAMGEGRDPIKVLRGSIMISLGALIELQGIGPVDVFIEECRRQMHQTAARFAPGSDEVN